LNLLKYDLWAMFDFPVVVWYFFVVFGATE